MEDCRGDQGTKRLMHISLGALSLCKNKQTGQHPKELAGLLF